MVIFRFVNERLLGEKVQKLENELIKPKDLQVFELKDFERSLMKGSLNLNRNQMTQTSTSAILNFQGGCLKKLNSFFSTNKLFLILIVYNTIAYDRNFTTKDSSSIEYKSNRISSYGVIISFFKIEGNFYLILRKFQVVNDTFLNSLSDLLKKYFYRFFNIVKLTENYEIIEWSKEFNRIVLVNYNEKYVISHVIKSSEKD